VLVNNAGITKDGAFHKMTVEQWNSVINTNLGSLFNMTRQVIEGMRARKFGRVINISSSMARRTVSARSIIRQPRPAISASPRRSRWRMPGWHHRERDLPGLYQHRMVQAVPKEVVEKSILR